ncbi:hypothetical protein D3C87_517610 [compost metagenome]
MIVYAPDPLEFVLVFGSLRNHIDEIVGFLRDEGTMFQLDGFHQLGTEFVHLVEIGPLVGLPGSHVDDLLGMPLRG